MSWLVPSSQQLLQTLLLQCRIQHHHNFIFLWGNSQYVSSNIRDSETKAIMENHNGNLTHSELQNCNALLKIISHPYRLARFLLGYSVIVKCTANNSTFFQLLGLPWTVDTCVGINHLATLPYTSFSAPIRTEEIYLGRVCLLRISILYVHSLN